MIELILGGARSGKSRYAEQRATLYENEHGMHVIMIATAEALDAEMSARIAVHRAQRPAHWQTVEAPLALSEALSSHAAPDACIIVECMTLWLSNVLHAECEQIIDPLIKTLGQLPGHLIIVSNEVGCGIVPANALARRFQDAQGRLNQRLAEISARVVLVTAGLALPLKT